VINIKPKILILIVPDPSISRRAIDAIIGPTGSATWAVQAGNIKGLSEDAISGGGQKSAKNGIRGRKLNGAGYLKRLRIYLTKKLRDCLV
jgi:hypothetical protein